MEMIFAVLAVALLLAFMWKVPYCGGSVNRRHGAVTVTYEAPLSVQGTNVGPTAAQIANQINEVSATVIASADGDTTATLTHSFGLNAAALALGHP